MKNRKLRTICERYSSLSNVDNLRDLKSIDKIFLEKLHLYKNKIFKENKKFDFNDALNYCNILPKGSFYMKGRDKNGHIDFSDVSYLCYDHPRFKLRKLNTPDSEDYVKFYVVEISNGGWVFIIYEEGFYDLDSNFITDNKILLDGNIGILVK